jgi:hypothetical protein
MARRRAVISVAAVLLALVALVLSGGLAPQGQLATPAPSGGALATGQSVRCTPETGSLPALLASDPCPSADLAVELAVAPVRLPIERVVIEPGPFFCDVIWPGVGSPRICRGAAVLAGQFMHAWVSFVGSDKVAAVMLGLDLPDDLDAPGATRPPWHATLVATEVPPAGWVMP